MPFSALAGVSAAPLSRAKAISGIRKVYHGGLIQKQLCYEAVGCDAHSGGKRFHKAYLHQLRARAEVYPVYKGGQRRGEYVYCHAVHYLLCTEGYGSVGVYHVHQYACGGARQNAQKGVAGYKAHKEAHKGAYGGQAFKAYMYQARPLGIQLCQRQEYEGRSHSYTREEKI